MDCAWGTYERRNGKITIKVKYGELEMKSLRDSLLDGSKTVKSNVSEFKKHGTCLIFEKPVKIKSGEELKISLS